MSKIVFITFYTDFSVGVNTLSSVLADAGHDVSNIFFKLPSYKKKDWFSDNTDSYMEIVDPNGDIVTGDLYAKSITQKEIDLLSDKLADLKPDIVGFSTRTMYNDMALDTFPKIKIPEGAVTMAGGFGPSINPELYVDLVDYVFVGEAEGSIVDIILALGRGESIKKMNNIFC